MATLQKIRNRGGLIVIIIGIALLAFVLGDILNSKSGSLFSSSQYEVANVDDQSIPLQLYQQKLEEAYQAIKLLRGGEDLDEQVVESIQDQTWNSIIQTAVMESDYQQLGIGISSDELKDMFVGDNIHPIVAQVFGNPDTKEVNTQAVQNFIQNIDGQFKEQKPILIYLENEVIEKQKTVKYNNLIKKAVYVTKFQAEEAVKEKSTEVDFNFVAKKYSEISDSLVSIGENDIKKYYNENKDKYKQEASRSIAYVAWDVVASPEDNEMTQKWINDIASEFRTTENTVQFVNFNSDVSFDPKNYKQGELPESIDSVMFAADSGFVYGPYFEDRIYKLAKLHAINYLPDSVMASHILIKYEQDQAQYDAAHAKLDSLKLLLEGGADFAALAMTNSADGSAQAGGDLGWFKEGQMVKPFSDACFKGKVGDLVIIDSQFGSHLIKITGRGAEVKKVQVAIVERALLPSTKTYQSFYKKASEFAGANRTEEQFNLAVSEQNLNKRVAQLTENQKQVGGLENPRELVRWTFESEKGQVSDEVFEFGNRYVVAVVTDVKEKGIAPLAQKRAEVEVAVKQKKKAELFAEKFNAAITAGKSLEDIAQEQGLRVEEAKAINFAAFQVAGYGAEHKVIAAAVALGQDKISKAIEGSSAVFVIQTKAVVEKTNGNIDAEKSRLLSASRQQADYAVYNSLKEKANVVDNRAKFY
ncbi:MAG: SurA N-terminal domain-containing protein [Bacteroidales bacterium]|nr:SurA N-terminal domain-containing protein [Bacteroidales bacterium]MCF8454596.1 SurA N-terminal domain-containing protein [Bacteroidales bacterium]